MTDNHKVGGQNWAKLRAVDPNFDWDGLEMAYDLAGVKGLPASALRGLLSERISAEQAATMSDHELLDVHGVGPVSVQRLRSTKQEGGA